MFHSIYYFVNRKNNTSSGSINRLNQYYPVLKEKGGFQDGINLLLFPYFYFIRFLRVSDLIVQRYINVTDKYYKY